MDAVVAAKGLKRPFLELALADKAHLLGGRSGQWWRQRRQTLEGSTPWRSTMDGSSALEKESERG